MPPDRVLLSPAPGLATEADLIATNSEKHRLCELVDGVLVEKAMGYQESLLAIFLGGLLNNFVTLHNLGLISGPDGMMRLFPGLVRIPDLAFAGWDRFTDRRVPKDSVPELTPDLAIEIISPSNTSGEWPETAGLLLGGRTSGVDHRSLRSDGPRLRGAGEIRPDRCFRHSGGGSVLPGFSISVEELFSCLDRHAD